MVFEKYSIQESFMIPLKHPGNTLKCLTRYYNNFFLFLKANLENPIILYNFSEYTLVDCNLLGHKLPRHCTEIEFTESVDICDN